MLSSLCGVGHLCVVRHLPVWEREREELENEKAPSMDVVSPEAGSPFDCRHFEPFGLFWWALFAACSP